MQLSMSLEPPKPAEVARDHAIASAVAHADAEAPGWSDKAYALLAEYARSVNGEFLAEDVRHWAETRRGLPAPPDNRAWGGVFKKAVRGGVVQRTGYAASKNTHAHCRPCAVWKRRVSSG